LEWIRKGIVNMKVVEVDVEAVYGEYVEQMVEKADVQPQNKWCVRFIKHLIQNIKTLGHHTRCQTPPTQSVSFFSLPPHSNLIFMFFLLPVLVAVVRWVEEVDLSSNLGFW